MINDTSRNTFNILAIDDIIVTVEAYTEGTQPTDDWWKRCHFDQKTLGACNTEWVRWSAELNAESVLKMNFLGRLIGESNACMTNTKLTKGPSSCDSEGIVTNCAN